MARPLRLEYPGALYHVTSRGNARQRIFQDDRDREPFVDLFGEVIKRFGWLCHGYCLMENHYHLLIETPLGNLSAGMRQLNGLYTQRVIDYRPPMAAIGFQPESIGGDVPAGTHGTPQRNPRPCRPCCAHGRGAAVRQEAGKKWRRIKGRS